MSQSTTDISNAAALGEHERKKFVAEAEVWVVKAGSRILTLPGGGLDREQIRRISGELAALVKLGKKVVFISSGAVASGVGRLGLPTRPKDLATLQAVAAVGQAQLIQAYQEELAKHDLQPAQILLTAADLDDRVRYLNVRNAIAAIHSLGAIPIINENDTVAVEELQATFGDNDRLAAMVAGLFTRPLLVILSDVGGLYDRDPSDSDARVLPAVTRVDSTILELVRDKQTGVSKGGMASKLSAARFVNASGAAAIIAWGKEERILSRLASGETLGTLFLPRQQQMEAKKRWIGFSTHCAGQLVVDAGAAHAITIQNRSLLPIGIHEIHGEFEKGDTVAVLDPEKKEIARGQSNYSAEEVRRIRGCRSSQIEEILGHRPYENVIHRDSMVVSPVNS